MSALIPKTIMVDLLHYRELRRKYPNLNFSEWIRKQMARELQKEIGPTGPRKEVLETKADPERLIKTEEGEVFVDVTPEKDFEDSDEQFLESYEKLVESGGTPDSQATERYKLLKEAEKNG